MGGKTKQSQRTKNNARPSSSGRSALLLSNVKLESGVMNVTGTELPALFPTLVAPTIDPLVSPELQLCIKKLNKKDPITKTKALQELSELVTNSKIDDVVAALPSWAHFYKILTADPDRKVREATQACHGSIMCMCGRRAAPHLKQLMPAWLQAQYDEHAPAHTHARNSLARTFPDNKLPEVLSFCRSEVVAHIVDTLVAGGDAAYIRKTDSAEEREAQQTRVIASVLRGAQYAVQHLPHAQHDWLWDRLAPLLQHNLFWKRAAHHDARIRAAWYALVGRCVERWRGTFAECYGDKTLRILVAAAETSPLAAAQLWDSVLLFMYSVEEWHKYLDKKELLNKRILEILESGGWGDARHLSNMLLPLLAHLPASMLNREFYISFFDALFNGLDKKTILSSKSERQSWITSLDECLRYLSIQQHDYVLEIVTSVHRTWLERILSDSHDGQIRTNLIKYSATNMAALVKYWLKQAKEENSEKYDQLIRNFWQNVGATVTAQVNKLSTDHADINRLIEGHILLLQTLKTSFVQEKKKQHSIKFDGDSPAVVEQSQKETPCDASIVDRYNHNLNDSVEKICGHYFEFAGKKQISSPVLAPLITLLVEFDSKNLFTSIARQFDVDSTYKLYDKVLRSWVAGDTMRCKAVVDIVFLMLKHLSEEEQDALFDSFNQFPPSVVEWCISLSLSHPHCSVAAARRWVRGPLVDASVAGICARLTDHGDCNARNLLLMCLNLDASGETMISTRGVSSILQRLSEAVCDVTSPHLESTVTMAAALATTVAAPGLAALVRSLFRLSVLVPRGSPRLSVATWGEVRAAWQDGLQALAAARGAVLGDIAATVHAHLPLDSNLIKNVPQPEKPPSDKENTDCLDIKHMEHVVSLCPYLLSADSTQDISEIVLFTRQMFDIRPNDPALVHKYVLRHSIVRGDINCPIEDSLTKSIINDHARNKLDEVKKDNVKKYMSNCIFRALYLRTILLHRVDEDLEDTWCNVLFVDGYFVQEFCKLMHDYMVVRTMSEAYGFWEYYFIVQDAKERMDTLIDDIISECSPKTITSLLNALSEHAAAKGYYWSFAMKYLEIGSKKQAKNIPANSDAKSDNSQKEESADVDVSQEEIKSNKNETESRKNETGSIENKPESSHNETVSGENETESSKNETENSQNEMEGSHKETESSQKSEDIQTAKNEDTEHSIWDDLDVEKLSEMVTGNGFFHSLQANEKWEPTEASSLRTAYVVMLRGVCTAHAGVLDARFVRDVTSGRAACHADVVVNAYYNHAHIMLHDTDISEAPWSQVVSNASIMQYLCAVISARGWDLPPHHWDFATITLCHALTAVLHSKHKWGSTKVALFTRAALKLYLVVESFISSVAPTCLVRQPSKHVSDLPKEWRDIFAPDLHYSLFSFIMFVLGSGASVTGNHVAVVELAVECSQRLQWQALPAQPRRGEFALAGLARHALAALERPAHYCYKYLAYYLLRAIQKPMVLEDADKLSAWSEEAGEEEEERAPAAFTLRYYEPAYRRLADIVHTAVAHVKLCEATCSLVAHSDVHSLCAGWLLLADCLHNQLRLARGDLTHHYMQTYRDGKFAEPLLTAALRLLPPEVFAHAAEPTAAPAPPAHQDMFARVAPLHVYECVSVSRLACRGAALAAGGAGAGDARGWRGAADHRHAAFLDNLMEAYVTPHIVKELFTQVHQRASEVEDSEITILWSAYELVCVLTVEDRPIELKVQLSRSFPLGPPKCTAADNAPLTNTGWLVMYLAYQNGSVLNALKMWVEAVTRKVERASQCYICYCRLHHATGRLPSSSCHQCRNRFHTACLRKWFATSNKSNCPLCRTNF